MFSICLAVAFAGAGCSLPRRYYVPEYHAASVQKLNGKRVALELTAIDPRLPRSAEKDIYVIDQIIRGYLETHGYSVLTMTAAVSPGSSEAERTYRETREQVFAALKDLGRCDLAMFPMIVIRQAQLQNDEAGWDGVIRPIPMNDAASSMVFSGYQKAASLMIGVFTCEGEPVLRSLGGIDIPFAININIDSGSSGYMSTPDTYSAAGASLATYLSNRGYLTEAVQLALHPLIPMETYPPDPEPYVLPQR